jgi:hypothetical protein
MEPEGSLPQLQDPATSIQSMPPPPCHCVKRYSYLILLSMPGSPKWSPSLRSPCQNPVCSSPFPHMCYISLTHFGLSSSPEEGVLPCKFVLLPVSYAFSLESCTVPLTAAGWHLFYHVIPGAFQHLMYVQQLEFTGTFRHTMHDVAWFKNCAYRLYLFTVILNR